MKKAVFFDIDGTLWNEYMEIPPSTVEAVRALKETGCYAFICSGRSRANIRSRKLLDIGFDGVVAACGTHIDFHGEMAFERLMEQEQVWHVLDVMKRHGIPVVLEGPAYIYLDKEQFTDDPYVIHLRRELGDDVKSIAESDSYEINKLSAVLNGADFSKVQEDLGDDYDVIRHGEELIEIGLNGYSKATGVEKVCELFGIDLKDTYAFGDSANDIEMIEAVGHGIAMGNATEELKRTADYVTTDIMEDGIRNGLMHYGLIS